MLQFTIRWPPWHRKRRRRRYGQESGRRGRPLERDVHRTAAAASHPEARRSVDVVPPFRGQHVESTQPLQHEVRLFVLVRLDQKLMGFDLISFPWEDIEPWRHRGADHGEHRCSAVKIAA